MNEQAFLAGYMMEKQAILGIPYMEGGDPNLLDLTASPEAQEARMWDDAVSKMTAKPEGKLAQLLKYIKLNKLKSTGLGAAGLAGLGGAGYGLSQLLGGGGPSQEELAAAAMAQAGQGGGMMNWIRQNPGLSAALGGGAAGLAGLGALASSKKKKRQQ